MNDFEEKKFFDRRPQSVRRNSISCLNDSISCLKIKFETLWENENDFEREVFFNRGLEVGEKIPFPVIQIDLEPLGSNEKDS